MGPPSSRSRASAKLNATAAARRRCDGNCSSCAPALRGDAAKTSKRSGSAAKRSRCAAWRAWRVAASSFVSSATTPSRRRISPLLPPGLASSSACCDAAPTSSFLSIVTWPSKRWISSLHACCMSCSSRSSARARATSERLFKNTSMARRNGSSGMTPTSGSSKFVIGDVARPWRNQRSIAVLSYAYPSYVITGSRMMSPVMGHSMCSRKGATFATVPVGVSCRNCTSNFCATHLPASSAQS
mmetsp:Transcript_83936/g.256426  ORF Transcript_83936/g.256426 Transcript_83936/m.256426 type:complete len:242 (-) Transcript_83936:315-1040(-)